MHNDIQKLDSATKISDAILDCIRVLRREQKLQYKGDWDTYIDDVVYQLMDGSSDITGTLRKNICLESENEYNELLANGDI